jgi:hypothetical protein
MAFTPITVTTPAGPNIASASAGALTVSMAAADSSNGNSFPFTGNELLVMQNTDTSSHNVVLNSAADSIGRSADITYALAAGEIATFNYRRAQQGWAQSDGTAHVTAASALVKLGVIKPAA